MGRLVVLVSGNGSNLQAVLDACAGGTLDAEVVAVLSNRPDAFGLTRAQRAGVPVDTFPLGAWRRAGGDRVSYDLALAERIAPYKPDLIILAGWMLILGEGFLDRFPGKVINLHPALPGEFAGTDAIARAYAASRQAGLRRTGVMVHHVIPEVDAGPVVASAEVPILPDDDLAALKARIHHTEHRLLVTAVDRLLHPMGAP